MDPIQERQNQGQDQERDQGAQPGQPAANANQHWREGMPEGKIRLGDQSSLIRSEEHTSELQSQR